MSHLNRVLLLFPLLLLCTSSLPAQTVTPYRIPVNQTAEGLRDLCREAIAGIEAFRKAGEKSEITPLAIEHLKVHDPAKGGACLGYIQGAVDGLNLAMMTGEVQKSFQACIPAYHAQLTRPEGVTTDEMIRVFLEFIDSHPENLSYAAADVVWRAMSASYPCPVK